MLQAFKLMRKKRIGGIPVIENGGNRAVGNISLRDVQFLLTAPEIYHDYRFVSKLISEIVFLLYYVLCLTLEVLRELISDGSRMD